MTAPDGPEERMAEADELDADREDAADLALERAEDQMLDPEYWT
jgi:hypothetical protein